MIAIGLDEGDQLNWVRLTNGENDIILVTANGQALRYSEKEIRAMGRQAGGVAGIKLRKGDRLASMEVVEPGGFLLVITEQGYGKRSPLEDYSSEKPRHRRRGDPGPEAHCPHRQVAAARVVQEEDEVTFISAGGRVLRLKIKKDIHPMGRATRGVHLMDMASGDMVASLARTSAAELNLEVDENGSSKEKPGEN